MKSAEELYGNEIWYTEYTPMLEEFGEIIIRVDVDDYQGDSYLIYKDGDRYGYLSFGWGSCSGCDALQGCCSIREVQELMDKLYNDIIWFDSKVLLKEYFNTKDWSLEWSWYYSEFRDFLKKVEEF